MYAHYFEGNGRKFLIITDNVQGRGGKKVSVSGKREARKVAREAGAHPWNF